MFDDYESATDISCKESRVTSLNKCSSLGMGVSSLLGQRYDSKVWCLGRMESDQVGDWEGGAW